MQKDIFPYLVIEKRNNDFSYINLADLDLFDNANYNDLYSLDYLLQHFTEQEIKDSIKRANIIADTDIDNKKLLIKYGNYKLPLITDELLLDIQVDSFIKETFLNNDKTNKNIIYNKIASIVKDEKWKTLYKNIIDYNNYDSFMMSLSELDYPLLRELYFYLYNYVAKKTDIRDNERKREKVND